MLTKNTSVLLPFLSVCVLLSYPLTDIHAQAIEEIVVTAQKRGAVNVQDVAESIQAFSSDQLENEFTEGFDDYSRRVPSLSAVNQGSGQTQIVFRGVTAARVTHAQPQDRSTAGLYVDETPVTSNAFNPDVGLFDVNRVEVLRGPQGTLYGASSMSGAVRVITNEPNVDEFEAKGDVTLSNTDGGGFNNSEKFMVNVPIAEGAFALRAVGYHIEKSGYIDNVVNGENNINDEESFGGRISALWSATDRFSARATVTLNDLEADGRADEYLPADAFLAGATGVTITDELQTAKFTNEPFDDELVLSNLTLKYETDNHEIVSSTSYLDRELENQLDDAIRVQFFFGPGLTAPFFNNTEVEDFTQELRISNTNADRLSYVFGLFYQNQDKTFNQIALVPGSDALFAVYGIPPAGVFGATMDSIFDGNTKIEAEQIAGFGEVAWQITEQWELTVGLRVFDWTSEADISFAGLVQSGADQRTGESSETGVSPKFRVSYQHNDDVLFYGVASKGFRIGGVNEPVSPTLCAPDLAAIGSATQTPETFDSDDLWNFELGAKTSWADDRLYFNVSGYKIEWSDLQSSVLLPTCGFSFVDNSGDVDIWGVEVEAIAAPTDNLDLYFNASWTDGELVSNPNTLGVATFGSEGDRVPNVPEYTMSAGFGYTRPGVFQDFEGFLRASVEYAGSSYSQFNATATAVNFVRTPKIPNFISGNVSLGLENDEWEFAFFVKNIGDERIVSAVDTDRIQPPTFTRARPRTYGINIRKNW